MIQVPSINIDIFSGSPYNIKCVYENIANVNFIDFNSAPNPYTTIPNLRASLSKSIYTNKFNLREFGIIVPKDNILKQSIDNNLKQSIVNNIIAEITANFIQKISKLGDLHNKEVSNVNIPLRILRKNYSGEELRLKIISNINRANHYIANNSRLGLANWMIMNNKTFNDLNLYNVGIKYYLSEFVDDGVVYMGCDNEINSSVQVIIRTDNNNNIIFNCFEGDDNNILLTFNYNIIEQGFNPHYSFMTINTKDNIDERYMKLKKIKEIYG